jgi:hypothetical protein
VGGGSEEKGEGLGGEEGGGGESRVSARMGRGGGSIGTEGGVLGNNRKDMSSTEKAGRSDAGRRNTTHET